MDIQAQPSHSAGRTPVRPLPQSKGGRSTPAFDRWLERELTRSYGAVLKEEVPESLLALIDQKPAKPRD